MHEQWSPHEVSNRESKVLMKAANKLIASALLSGIILCACQKEEQPPRETEGKSDVHAFIITEIAKSGGVDKRSSLPSRRKQIPYRYSQDKDGFQVFCDGDKTADLAAMLQASYGPPKVARTNSAGDFFFIYSISQIGVAINCGVDIGSEGKAGTKLTHLVGVRANALR
ncbi:MAG: hypothetical protein HZA89_00605 [Verrucomicrobia bacterium]|nr:hypothetical protein [Verrucomicrobiota bacterium]